MNRRIFSQTLSAAMLCSGGLAAGKLSLHIGHTGLTWIPLGGAPGGPRPAIDPMADPQYVEAAIKDISALGFYGIELFGNQIEAMEAKGGVGGLLEKYKLALISAYCGANLSDPAQRKTSGAVIWDLVFSGEEARYGIHYAFGVYNAFDWHYSDPVSTEFVQRAIAQSGRSFMASLDMKF